MTPERERERYLCPLARTSPQRSRPSSVSVPVCGNVHARLQSPRPEGLAQLTGMGGQSGGWEWEPLPGGGEQEDERELSWIRPWLKGCRLPLCLLCGTLSTSEVSVPAHVSEERSLLSAKPGESLVVSQGRGVRSRLSQRLLGLEGWRWDSSSLRPQFSRQPTGDGLLSTAPMGTQAHICHPSGYAGARPPSSTDEVHAHICAHCQTDPRPLSQQWHRRCL